MPEATIKEKNKMMYKTNQTIKKEVEMLLHDFLGTERWEKEEIIQYFGKPMKVNCDGKCHKAWGINSRPKEQLSDDEDDYVFLADGELGEAPNDPRIYEGRDGKPESVDEFPNKWCVRECERCAKSQHGEWMNELKIKQFDSRVYNITSH